MDVTIPWMEGDGLLGTRNRFLNDALNCALLNRIFSLFR